MADSSTRSSATAGCSAPSIFDVLAQESLMSGLRPALNYLAKYMTTSSPEKFGVMFRWFDEIYACFDLLLENYYLKKYSASFSENFYGLKRVVAENGKYLTSRKRSLFFLVVAPYLKLKLDRLYEKLRGNYQSDFSIKKGSGLSKLLSAFVAVYPLLTAGLEMWTLCLQVAYILSRSHIHSPWLLFAGVRLAHLTAQDVARFGDTNCQLPSNASLMQRLYHVIGALARFGFRTVSKLLGIGLFFLQFLDWWFNSEQAPDTRSLTALPRPPAPQLVLSEPQVLKMNPRSCPICRKQRKNDTLLAVSGYVFCYGCIWRHLESNRCCPVTKVPASAEHLVRLFIDTNQLNRS